MTSETKPKPDQLAWCEEQIEEVLLKLRTELVSGNQQALQAIPGFASVLAQIRQARAVEDIRDTLGGVVDLGVTFAMSKGDTKIKDLDLDKLLSAQPSSD